MWIAHFHREGMQASTACVIARALPEVHHFVKFRFGHRGDRREAVQKASPIRNAPRHLRLLKEHLGEQNGPWVGRGTPRQITGFSFVPARERLDVHGPQASASSVASAAALLALMAASLALIWAQTISATS